MPHTEPHRATSVTGASSGALLPPVAVPAPAAIAAPAAVDDPAGHLAHLLARARQERRLLSIHWELTHRCNERCRHCFLAVSGPDDAVVAKQELTTAEALALIDQLAGLGVLYVTFSGGEPLLRDDFFVLAEHVRRRRLALRVYTNGRLLTTPAAYRLAALHPLAVEISVYAADPATHDAITGIPGSWDVTVDALQRLQALGVRTVCKTPLMALNAGQVEPLSALAAQLGARFQPDPVLTSRVAGTLQDRRAPLTLRMSDGQLADYLRRTLGQSASRCRAQGLRNTPTPVQLAPAQPGPLLCTIGRSTLALDPYGTVFACVEVRQPLGNVRRTPLAAIWHDADAWSPYLRLSAPASTPGSMIELTTASVAGSEDGVQALHACRTCCLAAYCVRCHGAAGNETGDLYGPSPAHCRLAGIRRQILRELGEPVRE
jgi:MoaA/NifB/PqqE/SkfB family radical SAM enzyme